MIHRIQSKVIRRWIEINRTNPYWHKLKIRYISEANMDEFMGLSLQSRNDTTLSWHCMLKDFQFNSNNNNSNDTSTTTTTTILLLLFKMFGAISKVSLLLLETIWDFDTWPSHLSNFYKHVFCSIVKKLLSLTLPLN